MVAAYPDAPLIMADAATKAAFLGAAAQTGFKSEVGDWTGRAGEINRAIDVGVDAALAPGAPLPGGGRLWFDEAKALTAIDVDAGGAVSASGDVALAVNLRAAGDLPKAAALRGLGGLLVVDFLNMRAPAARAQLEQAVRAGFAKDQVQVSVGRLSKAGVLEIQRARTGPSLLERCTEASGAGPVPGRRLTAQCCADRAARQLDAALEAAPGDQLRLDVSSDVADVIDGNTALLNRIRERRGARFSIAARADLQREACHVGPET